MGRLKLCRVCLVENVRMFIVADCPLQQVFEKLTNIPFMTEDRRPMLACFICYTKLKQCHRFMTKCLEAEEVFAQMLNEDYEPNQLQVQIIHQFLGGFVKTPIENIDIVDGEPQVVSVKEELPIEYEPDYVDLNEEDDSNETPDAKKLKLDIQKCEAIISTKQKKKRQVNTKGIDTTKSLANKSVSKIKEPITPISISKSKVNNSVIKKEIIDTEFITIDIKLRNEISIDKDDLKCQICDYMATNSHDIKQHNSSHSNISIEEIPHKCDVSQRSFPENLKTHMRTHTGEKPFKCNICQRNFIQTNDLERHMRTHTGEKPHKCDVCQRGFSEKSTLKRHMHTHTGEKPYKCDECQKSFSDKSYLRIHERIHTGKKPYKCDICQRNFAQTSDLKRHMRTHNGIKPHKCDICQKSFTEKGHLVSHMRTHTGEKPYKCDVCQKSFSFLGSFGKHMRTHTRE